jgi:hypothetical protein
MKNLLEIELHSNESKISLFEKFATVILFNI